MDREKLLVITMEECGELVRACSKILRHGTEKDPKYMQNLIEELADVIAMTGLVIDEFEVDDVILAKAIQRRVLKTANPEYL